MVGTAWAFWMRSVRACATDGARLMPSAPRVPRAAVIPPESLTKSRRESAPWEPKLASSLGGGAGAAIGERDPPTGIVELATGVVNMPGVQSATVRGRRRSLYCVRARRHRRRHSRLSPRRRSQMFKKSEEQEWTRFRGALSKDRDDGPAAPVPPDVNETTSNAVAPAPPAVPGSSGPSFRPSAGDVNVGLP